VKEHQRRKYEVQPTSYLLIATWKYH